MSWSFAKQNLVWSGIKRLEMKFAGNFLWRWVSKGIFSAQNWSCTSCVVSRSCHVHNARSRYETNKFLCRKNNEVGTWTICWISSSSLEGLLAVHFITLKIFLRCFSLSGLSCCPTCSVNCLYTKRRELWVWHSYLVFTSRWEEPLDSCFTFSVGDAPRRSPRVETPSPECTTAMCNSSESAPEIALAHERKHLLKLNSQRWMQRVRPPSSSEQSNLEHVLPTFCVRGWSRILKVFAECQSAARPSRLGCYLVRDLLSSHYWHAQSASTWVCAVLAGGAEMSCSARAGGVTLWTQIVQMTACHATRKRRDAVAFVHRSRFRLLFCETGTIWAHIETLTHLLENKVELWNEHETAALIAALLKPATLRKLFCTCSYCWSAIRCANFPKSIWCGKWSWQAQLVQLWQLRQEKVALRERTQSGFERDKSVCTLEEAKPETEFLTFRHFVREKLWAWWTRVCYCFKNGSCCVWKCPWAWWCCQCGGNDPRLTPDWWSMHYHIDWSIMWHAKKWCVSSKLQRQFSLKWMPIAGRLTAVRCKVACVEPREGAFGSSARVHKCAWPPSHSVFPLLPLQLQVRCW